MSISVLKYQFFLFFLIISQRTFSLLQALSVFLTVVSAVLTWSPAVWPWSLLGERQHLYMVCESFWLRRRVSILDSVRQKWISLFMLSQFRGFCFRIYISPVLEMYRRIPTIFLSALMICIHIPKYVVSTSPCLLKT